MNTALCTEREVRHRMRVIVAVAPNRRTVRLRTVGGELKVIDVDVDGVGTVNYLDAGGAARKRFRQFDDFLLEYFKVSIFGAFFSRFGYRHNVLAVGRESLQL